MAAPRTLDPLVQPGDTILCEVSFGAGPVTPGAASPRRAGGGRSRRADPAGRVLLTHLQMGFDETATIASVQSRFDGPVALVWPGDRFVIGG